MSDWLEQARHDLARAVGDEPVSYELSAEDVGALLELAHVAAHDSGERTNAPVTTYLLGLARGRQAVVLCAGADKVQAARCADRAVQYLGSHGVAARGVGLKSDRPPAEVIRGHAAELDAELIVMGAYGKSTLRELIIGSTTRSVLKDCPVPVFLSH